MLKNFSLPTKITSTSFISRRNQREPNSFETISWSYSLDPLVLGRDETTTAMTVGSQISLARRGPAAALL
jgi:hypothetical protein